MGILILPIPDQVIAKEVFSYIFYDTFEVMDTKFIFLVMMTVGVIVIKETVGQDDIECPIICNRMYLPVCGSDGSTYSNECMLRFDKCNVEGKSNLRILSEGECPIKT